MNKKIKYFISIIILMLFNSQSVLAKNNINSNYKPYTPSDSAYKPYKPSDSIYKPYEVPNPVPSYEPYAAENGSYRGQISERTHRPKNVYVRSYHRKNGTPVQRHYRSKRK